MLKTFLSKILAGSLLLGCLASPLAESTAHAQDRVIVEVYAPSAPPIARAETVVIREGWLWSRGHYYWNTASWAWIPGHYVRIIPNRVWLHPHYIVRGRRWVFVRGHWA